MGIDAQMLVRHRNVLTEREVRALSFDLAEAFGHDSFWIGEDWPIYDDSYEKQIGKGRHALQIVGRYTQDGDDIVPDPGEQFIEVHVATRYYGEGYERGDIVLITNVAAWLEVRLPGASIWYGGDSSGICAEPFDAKARAEHFAHFAKVGHKPYHGGFGSVFGSGRGIACDFCGPVMTNFGGGKGVEFLSCVGCGKKVVHHTTTGAVEVLARGKDFFDRDRSLEAPDAKPEKASKADA